MNSICIFCGSEKAKPLDICNVCSKTPVTKTQCLHSIILSFDKYRNENFLDEDSIKLYSEKIKNNEKLVFDKNLINKANDVFTEITSVSNFDLFMYTLKFAWPISIPIVIIILYFLIF